MAAPTNLSEIASAIQMSVAPSFLLTGMGAILTVMANRLARVVDRFRQLRETDVAETAQMQKEVALLVRRSHWVHWAISLSTLAALLVCVVVVAIFAGAELHIDPKRAVSMLFISAMLVQVAGLLCFLREIHLSTGIIDRPQRGGRIRHNRRKTDQIK